MCLLFAQRERYRSSQKKGFSVLQQLEYVLEILCTEKFISHQLNIHHIFQNIYFQRQAEKRLTNASVGNLRINVGIRAGDGIDCQCRWSVLVGGAVDLVVIRVQQGEKVGGPVRPQRGPGWRVPVCRLAMWLVPGLQACIVAQSRAG